MSRRIIKKIGSDRLGSGNKMTVSMHGYGFSSHDVSTVLATSMSFGTLVPAFVWPMTSNSRLTLKIDAFIVSNPTIWQLYGNAKFQVDVFKERVANYNPKMGLNLSNQGLEVQNILFPQMKVTTGALEVTNGKAKRQVNASSILAYQGIQGNGQNEGGAEGNVERVYNAMYHLMYYKAVRDYYANRQEGKGYIIHNTNAMAGNPILNCTAIDENISPLEPIPPTPGNTGPVVIHDSEGVLIVWAEGKEVDLEALYFNVEEFPGQKLKWYDIFTDKTENPVVRQMWFIGRIFIQDITINSWGYETEVVKNTINLVEYDLKAIDRMDMKILKNVDGTTPITLDGSTELPYGAALQATEDWRACEGTQEGLCVGCYQSDVFNNYLDNATIGALQAKSKVQVDELGQFSIDQLNIAQRQYNYDMRVGVTDGTLDSWREVTYGQKSMNRSSKATYEGGLSKEVNFDMVVSTATTSEEPLASVASRGQFSQKHKGGYVQIDTDEECLVMAIMKITPRLKYNQGNDPYLNFKSLDDYHKPAYDKIGYQNLLSDQQVVAETVVTAGGALITKSVGKQPAFQWYRTNYDRALGLMAEEEDYKVFGREYELTKESSGYWIVKDQTTYIDPRKHNDVFAIESLDAQNFDVQIGFDAKYDLVMSEEVIPGIN